MPNITGINYSTGAPYSAAAVGDGNADDTAVLQAALNACGLISIPAGTYKITTTLVMPGVNGAGIIGAGSASTTIKAAFTNGTAVKYAASLEHPNIRGIKITRVGTPSAGSYGLDIGAGDTLGLNTPDHGYLDDIVVQGHHTGVRLSSTGWSTAYNITSENNLQDGFFLTGQWSTDNLHANNNGRYGFYVTNALSSGNSQGQFNGLNTNGNASHGFYAVGSVYFLRLVNCNFLNDGGDGVLINTNQPDGINLFHNVTVSGVNGPSAWYFGPNAGYQQLTGCNGYDATYGLYSECTHVALQGGSWSRNTSYGVVLAAGKGSIDGITAATNLYGVGASAPVGKLTVTNSSLSGSTNPTDVSAIGANYFGYNNT